VQHSDPPERGPLTVEASSSASGKLVIRFVGVADREGAEAVRGVRLMVAAGERAPLEDPDEFYDSDLVGLAARTLAGAELGPVVDVVHAAGASYLVVSLHGRDHLIPFVGAIVPDVDLAAGRVTIDPPDGLFDL
jgi:16S rRNA processing protein RimM